MEEWIEKELETADFGDVRLNKRAALMLERLSGQSMVSIPAACRGWKETQAAYRFFSNPKVTEESVLRPHYEATERRMAEQAVVLLVQDTTEADYTGHAETTGLGSLNYEERIGLLNHVTLAVTPDRCCLGVMDVRIWGRRDDRERDRAAIKRMPIEAKESYRWIEGYRRACEVATGLPQTQIVSVADREGDIYELYVEAQSVDTPGKRAEWIVRSSRDRRVLLSDRQIKLLRKHLRGAPVVGQAEVAVARSRGRNEATVSVTVRASRVRLRPPYRRGTKLPEIQVNVVWVRESDSPAGCEPLDWLLFTSLPIDTLDAALLVADYYCCRWQIEIFFKVLKSGCAIEKLQLHSDERLKPAIALYAIIAWRVMYVVWAGRQCPQLPCTALFSDDEWKAVWTITKKAPLPDQPPPLADIVKLVAALGGHLGRKSDGPPGPKAMWIGLQRTRDFAHAWSTFGPDRRHTCV